MSASSDKMLDLLQQLSALNELEDQSRSDSKRQLRFEGPTINPQENPR